MGIGNGTLVLHKVSRNSESLSYHSSLPSTVTEKVSLLFTALYCSGHQDPPESPVLGYIC